MRMDAPCKEKAVCDIYLENLQTAHKFVMDVMVTRPNANDSVVRSQSLAAAKKGEEIKKVRYVTNYDINDADVIPLVFETYGGYAPSTLKFLKEISRTIAQNDEEMAGKILRHLRDRIAVGLHTGHGRVISELNSLNNAHSTLSRR